MQFNRLKPKLCNAQDKISNTLVGIVSINFDCKTLTQNRLTANVFVLFCFVCLNVPVNKNGHVETVS